jgi:hypothetical protein
MSDEPFGAALRDAHETEEKLRRESLVLIAGARKWRAEWLS